MSVSGAQILNNPWVWYSYNIPPMIKMLNQNMIQRAKLVCEKIGIISKITKKKLKPGWEIRLEMLKKKKRKLTKMIKQRKNPGTFRDKRKRKHMKK